MPTLLAHPNALQRLSHSQRIDFFGMDFPAAPEKAWPTVTIADECKLRLPGGCELRVVHVPNAHTDTDLFMHAESDDVIVCGSFHASHFTRIVYSGMTRK